MILTFKSFLPNKGNAERLNASAESVEDQRRKRKIAKQLQKQVAKKRKLAQRTSAGSMPKREAVPVAPRSQSPTVHRPPRQKTTLAKGMAAALEVHSVHTAVLGMQIEFVDPVLTSHVFHAVGHRAKAGR